MILMIVKSIFFSIGKKVLGFSFQHVYFAHVDSEIAGHMISDSAMVGNFHLEGIFMVREFNTSLDPTQYTLALKTSF